MNEALALRFFPDGAAIGRRIAIGRPRPGSPPPSVVEIVGIAADIREVSLRGEARRTIYVPQAQASDRLSHLRGSMPVFIARTHVRGAGGGAIASELNDTFRGIDPTLPRAEVFPLRDVLTTSLARERFGAVLLSVLATLALLLTAVGIYGVQAYAVRQRHREIGIRKALGAANQQVSRMVVAQGMAPVSLGVLLGIAISVASVRVATAYVWGVTPTDPATYAGAGLILLGVALLATWIPARNAAGMSPTQTLGSD